MQSALISDSQNLQLPVLNSGIAEVHQFLQPVRADANSAKYATAEAYTKRNFGYRRQILPKFVFFVHFIRITKLSLTFVLKGSKKGRKWGGRCLFLLTIFVYNVPCRGRLVHRRGEYYRL